MNILLQKLPFDLGTRSTFGQKRKPFEELVEPKKSSYCKAHGRLNAIQRTFLSQFPSKSCSQLQILKNRWIIT